MAGEYPPAASSPSELQLSEDALSAVADVLHLFREHEGQPVDDVLAARVLGIIFRSTVILSTQEQPGEQILPTEFPNIAGVAEAATILGVTKQRVHQLRAGNTPGFPEPVAQLRATPVWLGDDLQDYESIRKHRNS